jgi:O-antigen/teichoic acid export membrane protein
VATRELSKGTAEGGNRLLDELLGVRIVFGVAGVTIATAVALALGWSAVIVLGTLLAGLAALVVGVAHNVGSLLGSRLRWGRVAVTDLARAATAAAATAVLVIANAGMIAFFAALLLGALVALEVAVALAGHRRLPDLRGGLARWRALGQGLLPLAVATAVAVVYLRIVMVLTAVLTAAHETGTFAAAFRVVEVIAVVPMLVAGSMLPVLARAAQ